MKCVFVCLSLKMSTFPSRAERWRREARHLLGLAGLRPALAEWAWWWWWHWPEWQSPGHQIGGGEKDDENCRRVPSQLLLRAEHGKSGSVEEGAEDCDRGADGPSDRHVALGDHSQFCERNAVERNRSGRITSCAFTETVKEWGAHTDRALFARVSSLCVLLRILRRMFICPHNLGQTSRLRSRNTLNTQQGEGYLKYSDKCSDKRKRRHWGWKVSKCWCRVFETAAPPLLEVGKRDKICANQRTNEAAILAGKPFTSK